ncbi:hypothetical protein FJ936_09245 [Mesorhizobium sp. B2-4-13]|uniref:hypothetical protein n=1 Tax=Mesorhizobium sp. B2-4-13 TaxID=2589936 RepID=UPI001154068D|nr:hypothetical protein [Mesorhizobium sp. B2-4-13]TPK85713.1 hypothetical protein FJ936_09245 [Mesorhizobium sp. B2-4-13]
MLSLSLWDRVPKNLRLGLVPILTTALLVQSGTQTATLLSCLSHGTPFCNDPSKLSVIDIQGLLILVNFIVVFWFAYRALGQSLAKSGQVSLDVKVIGLGTAILSSLEIYGYALKNGVPERLVFALPVIFFVFIVPFILLRKAQSIEDTDDPRDATRQAYSSLRQVVVALVVCVVATVAGSLYYVLMTEGLHFGSAVFMAPLVNRETWVFNPAILGMGWIPVLIMTLKSDGSNDDVVPLGMTAAGVGWLLIGPLLINAAIGVVLISDSSILGTAAIRNETWSLWMAKAGLGAGLTVIFIAAFFSSKWLGFDTSVEMLTGAAIFAAAGALAGLAASSLQTSFGAPVAWNTAAAIHAGGFTIAYLAGVLAFRWIRRSFPDLILSDPIALLP